MLKHIPTDTIDSMLISFLINNCQLAGYDLVALPPLRYLGSEGSK